LVGALLGEPRATRTNRSGSTVERGLHDPEGNLDGQYLQKHQAVAVPPTPPRREDFGVGPADQIGRPLSSQTLSAGSGWSCPDQDGDSSSRALLKVLTVYIVCAKQATVTAAGDTDGADANAAFRFG
jgi:hypothetical protein